ncbi:MAG: RIP metalloprotease RseP [Patescibacteria group bacterium]|nr:RIP metalloprotease RseP [Patescibacteria group bacterium]
MLTTILVFVLVLGLIVFVHELGHFLTAKKFGVKAEEFGFGFPPRICGWRKVGDKRKFFLGNKDIYSDDTIYSLNWILLGGFVKIKGENGESNQDKDSFSYQKIWRRTLILSAGVLMNVILAFIIFSVGFSVGLPQSLDGDLPNSARIKNRHIQIIEVLADSPADERGIKMGDILIAIDDQEFKNISEIQQYVDQHQSQNINLTLQRGQDKINQDIVPIKNDDQTSAKIGVSLSETGIVSYPWYRAILLGITTTISLLWYIVVALFTIIKNLILGAGVPEGVAGPIGVAVWTGQLVDLGWMYVLNFVAILSLNLAIINFLPFPALDGGRVLFLVIEKLRGKPVDQRIENLIHSIGFILLILLMVLITYRDIVKYIF